MTPINDQRYKTLCLVIINNTLTLPSKGSGWTGMNPHGCGVVGGGGGGSNPHRYIALWACSAIKGIVFRTVCSETGFTFCLISASENRSRNTEELCKGHVLG